MGGGKVEFELNAPIATIWDVAKDVGAESEEERKKKAAASSSTTTKSVSKAASPEVIV